MASKITCNNIETNNSNLKNFLSVNDLRDKEFSNSQLSIDERNALKNFDRFRIAELNKQKTEKAFHNKYMQLQVMANLTPYEEFLKEDYFI